MTIIDATWFPSHELKMLLLKKPTLSELRMSGSKLFHSFLVEGKK